MTTVQDITAAAMWVSQVETGTLVSDPYPSRWGVSLRYHPELKLADIVGMTQEHAAAILGSESYWPRAWDVLPAFYAKPVLAFSILDGPSSAARTLQAALGVPQDGAIGPRTALAAQAASGTALDPVKGVLRRLIEAQTVRLKASPRWSLDGTGWIGRCAAALVAAAVDLTTSQKDAST